MENYKNNRIIKDCFGVSDLNLEGLIRKDNLGYLRDNRDKKE